MSIGQGDSLQELAVTILPDGAVCSVATVGVYQLDKTSVAAVSAPDVIATSAGSGVPGRWLLITGVAISTLVDPFLAEYYVDHTFVGTSTGSASNPFTTIAAAFAAAVALGLPGATIILPDAGSIVESVVFPSGGGDWEIRSAGRGRSAIIGTVTMTSVPQSFFRLTNVVVTGAVSGVATSSSANLFYCTNSLLSSTLSLTAAGSGVWFALFQGNADTQFVLGGGSSGATTVVGTLSVDKWYFGAAITVGIFNASNTRVPASLTLNGSTRSAIMQDCILQGGSMTITGSGGTATVAVDGYTYRDMLFRGLTLVATNLHTENANISQKVTLSGNNISTPLYGGGLSTVKSGAGLYRMTVSLNLIVAGTTGNLTANAIYVDLAGVTQTVAMAVLSNIAAAPGTAAQGFVDFWHDGSVALAYSITGVVTPGSLSYQVAVAANRLD